MNSNEIAMWRILAKSKGRPRYNAIKAYRIIVKGLEVELNKHRNRVFGVTSTYHCNNSNMYPYYGFCFKN